MWVTPSAELRERMTAEQLERNSADLLASLKEALLDLTTAKWLGGTTAPMSEKKLEELLERLWAGLMGLKWAVLSDFETVAVMATLWALRWVIPLEARKVMPSVGTLEMSLATTLVKVRRENLWGLPRDLPWEVPCRRDSLDERLETLWASLTDLQWVTLLAHLWAEQMAMPSEKSLELLRVIDLGPWLARHWEKKWGNSTDFRLAQCSARLRAFAWEMHLVGELETGLEAPWEKLWEVPMGWRSVVQSASQWGAHLESQSGHLQALMSAVWLETYWVGLMERLSAVHSVMLSASPLAIALEERSAKWRVETLESWKAQVSAYLE